MPAANLYTGDAKQTLRDLPESSVQMCVTSPPYWGLRDYDVDGQVGLEATPDEYVTRLVEVFREVRRVLAEDGTLWLNLGDTYAQREIRHRDGTSETRDRPNLAENLNMTGRKMDHGVKEKDLIGIPWRVALALQDDGWYLRSDIIWHKPNPMPESVTDRPTSSHEHIFLLSKSKQYYYDADAIREDFQTDEHENYPQRSEATKRGRNKTVRARGDLGGNEDRGNSGGYPPHENGRNKRDVWTVSTKPYPEAHFAVYPPELIEPCIEAGSAEGDTVLDPFAGAGTTGLVALAKGRDFTGIDLNREYVEMAAERIRQDAPLMNDVHTMTC